MKKLLLFFLFISSVIYAQPPIAQVSYYFSSCDNVGDGFAFFDITSYNEMILNGLSPNQYTISYHHSLEGAETKSEVALNPTAFIASSFTSIYIRVEQNSIPSNYAVNSYSFVVNGRPNMSQPSGMVIYENPSDGVAEFNLTLNESSILQGNSLSNVTVNYYLNREDAENGVNPILNPQSFMGTDLQNIFVRVHYNNTGCHNIKSFKLYVKTQDYTLTIPDSVLKAKLLSSSTTANIASSVNPNNSGTANIYSKIDSNNDGEIQFSEAQSIVYLKLSDSDITNLIGLEAFTNLMYFTCSNNSIANIDLSHFPHLVTAVAENTDAVTLNVTNCTNLEVLTCTYGEISTVDLSTCTNLKYLSIRNQQLGSLDLNQNQQIQTISAIYNNLTSFSLQDKRLRTLEIGFNNLTQLELTNLPFLYRMKAQNNNLSNVDLSSIAYQQEPNNLSADNQVDIGLNNNLNLQQVNLKNNYKNTEGSFFSSSLSGAPQVICIDANDSYTYFSGTPGSVSNTFCSYTPGDYNTISGVSQFDSSGDGCDSQDPIVSFLSFNVSLNGVDTDGKIFCNQMGVYATTIGQLGTYSLFPNLENPTYFNISPNPATVNIPLIDNSTTTQNFCITANGIHPDLEIVIVPIMPARPGFDAVYKIVYKNKGNQTVTGYVNFTYNEAVLDFVSSSVVPGNNGNGFMNWTVPNLAPFQVGSILVTLNVNSPQETPAVNIDDVLVFNAFIDVTTDDNWDDNNFDFSQIVVGSYDPNDITCLQGNSLPTTEMGTYLHYNIRFENTGTAPAENIVVTSEIDLTQYNLQSLQVMESSHPMEVKVTGNIAEFIFQSIDLDTGGHGNILLKLKSNNALSNNYVMNSADIFFDYNFPIETNDEETVFADLSKNDFNQDSSLQVYPNPTSTIVTIKSDSTINAIQVYDAQGRLLITKMTNDNLQTIDLASYATGIYYLSVSTTSGKQTQKIIKK